MKRHYSDKLKTTKQTLTTSKHSTEFTYSYFPFHFKENRDKLALTNRRWMCKKRQKIDDYHKLSKAKFRQRGRRREKAGPVTCVRLANQIRGFRHPARSDAREKNK